MENIKTIMLINLLFLLNINTIDVLAETPQLNIYKHNDNYIKAEWANEMNDGHVIYKTGFEINDELPRRTYNSVGNREYGGQEFVTEERFSGERSLRVIDSYTNGNYTTKDFNGNIDYQAYSAAIFSDRKYMKNGTDLSVSFRAKTTGEGHISLWGNGGRADFGIPMSQSFTEDVVPGQRTVKISDVSYFKNRLDAGQFSYIANQKGQYNYIHVISVDEEKSSLTFNAPFKGEFSKGDKLLLHQHRAPVTFNSRSFNSNEGWQLFNINTKVADFINYDTSKRGFELWIRTTTPDIVYIDDLKLGYATRNRLYRDNKLIYDGMLSDYNDKEAIDKVSPESVSNINIEVAKDNSKLKFKKPKDDGTKYNYRLEAIINNNKFPTYESISIVSGIEGYSYIIDNNPSTIPNNQSNVYKEEISIPKLTSDDKYYLHVKAIDNQGNPSTATHYEFDVYDVDISAPSIEIKPSETSLTHDDVILDIVATDSQSSIKSITLPDGKVINDDSVKYRVKENGDYIFVAEDIGGNVVKKNYTVDNIDKSTSSIVATAVDFGELEIKENAYTTYEKLEDLFIQDWRDGGNIWRVDVSTSRLESKDGHVLPKGTMLMNPYESININKDLVDNGNITKEVLIDSGDRTLINSNGARGEHYISFSEKSLGVVIDPSVIKNTNYESKITWSIKMAP